MSYEPLGKKETDKMLDSAVKALAQGLASVVGGELIWGGLKLRLIEVDDSKEFFRVEIVADGIEYRSCRDWWGYHNNGKRLAAKLLPDNTSKLLQLAADPSSHMEVALKSIKEGKGDKKKVASLAKRIYDFAVDHPEVEEAAAGILADMELGA